MPNTASAKKALRQNKRRKVYNQTRVKKMRRVVKDYRKSVVAKKGAEAITMLPSVFKALDKAAKTGAIKKKTADRMKSRLSCLTKTPAS